MFNLNGFIIFIKTIVNVNYIIATQYNVSTRIRAENFIYHALYVGVTSSSPGNLNINFSTAETVFFLFSLIMMCLLCTL